MSDFKFTDGENSMAKATFMAHEPASEAFVNKMQMVANQSQPCAFEVILERTTPENPEQQM